ncbi:phospholipase D-like domain-containing protein [uncultured Deinococcus sp.]|uniref:phospholipase D-like domain-containing protein n=1 Tax=uncultured Deinococcus sp. TaxID=158789 RepID=UPI00258758CB|nr:phospholipase D-like domain-containing protein [uncultured Deinococcus sp.]
MRLVPVLGLLLLIAGLLPMRPGGGAWVLPGGLTFLASPLPAPDRAALDGEALNACPPPAARLDRLLYERTRGEGAALSCGNEVLGLIHFPNPDAAYSDQPANPQGGFALVEAQLRAARREIVLANMLWEEGQDSPGAAVARTLAELRRDVQAHPERYPQGLTVRVLLGHSIRLDALTDPAANAFTAARQLLAAGIPLTGDTVLGWRLELADYRYAAPHQHAKLIVVDGQDVIAGGFNLSWMHLPATTRAPDAPRGGGQDLTDLALRVRGPVARHALAAFADGWAHSDLLECRAAPTPQTVREVCTFSGRGTLPLTWASPAAAPGDAHVYGLYRRSGYETQDDTVAELFGAADRRIDVMQSQVSGTLGCSLSLTLPGLCRFPEDQLPVWLSAVRAVRERGVTLRLLLDYDPLLQVEGISLLGSLRAALAPEGLAGHVQARWFAGAGGLHTKAALIDGEMLTVGSQNLHFSAFGPGGLSEYTLATSDAGTLRAFGRQFEYEWARAQPVTLPAWVP